MQTGSRGESGCGLQQAHWLALTKWSQALGHGLGMDPGEAPSIPGAGSLVEKKQQRRE